MNKASEIRDLILSRLEKDLIGPLDEAEVLQAEKIRPSDVYLSGMLWPLGARITEEDDDSQGSEDETDPSNTAATIVGQQRPSSMGISFATKSQTCSHFCDIVVRLGTYTHSLVTDEDGVSNNKWVRNQHVFLLESIDLSLKHTSPININEDELKPRIDLSIRSVLSSEAILSTVTLINRSEADLSDRDENESLTLFQVSLEVLPRQSTKIVPRPPGRIVLDSDEESARLLYRNCFEYATGHQCSVVWDEANGYAHAIRTTWIPSAVVPSYKEDGDNVFDDLISSGFLSARNIGLSDDADLYSGLEKLCEAYSQWISIQSKQADGLEMEYKSIASKHISYCKNVLDRMKAGIDAFKSDFYLRTAFKYANAAMSLQHQWKKSPSGGALPELRWRPFQLAFILLSAESTCNRASANREVLDLLWFPTGGGKTEAYLTIVGMLAWYRRLSKTDHDRGAGNAAIMRYTLRLLTAQQFERAVSLILACELIRRGFIWPREGKGSFGDVPFSIGLWVGRDATPNSYSSAKDSRGQKDGSSAEQLERCPCCGTDLSWNYDDTLKSVTPYCDDHSCAVGKKFGSWPVYTVDSDIYRYKPTLLIGTVDKFAQLPFNDDMSDLFSFRNENSTDLIIQDELHLISGPLGTVCGLYETAFDWLIRKGGSRSKVIGSTATIRRADEQVRSLFDRTSCQFPPPGIDYDNSGFAVVDDSKPGRLYAGITTAGRSAKFSLQAASASLLQSGKSRLGLEDNLIDGYTTLLCYFNSLRELGGAIVQMLDDVPDSIRVYSSRRGESSRRVDLPRELTSRESQKRIIEILEELKESCSSEGFVDVVLATNMVSVGIDIPRLGLMLVNGQPKTRSEYIQATSRVGRSTFPGLVINVFNHAKARDRSHYETFYAWHRTIYRDVEATSVTPFASRARDRALRAVLVSMIRHGAPGLRDNPKFSMISDKLLTEITSEIDRRVSAIDAKEKNSASQEVDEALFDWEARNPERYIDRYKPDSSLMQYAEDHASKRAAGRLTGSAWPTMNTMRTVEAATRFRLVEELTSKKRPVTDSPEQTTSETQPRWRKRNG
jgi:hypothetical protein